MGEFLHDGSSVKHQAHHTQSFSLVELEPGAVVQDHCHMHEQVGILLEGELTFTIGGETRTLVPGDLWRIPGGTVHRAVAGSEPVKALDVFAPVREDYL